MKNKAKTSVKAQEAVKKAEAEEKEELKKITELDARVSKAFNRQKRAA